MRNVRPIALVVLITAAAVLASGTRLNAQVTTATLFGTVRDTTGAIVPGATISAINEGTGLTRRGALAARS